jgi:hypothetical protein
MMRRQDLGHLLLEDAAVLLEKIFALHAVLAGEGAEHDHGVSAGEGHLLKTSCQNLASCRFVTVWSALPRYPSTRPTEIQKSACEIIGYLGIAGGHNTLEEGVGGVLKLHLDTAQSDLHALDVEIEEVKLDRLVGTEGLARADVGEERIANLASGTGNADGKGSLGHCFLQKQIRAKRSDTTRHKKNVLQPPSLPSVCLQG